MIIKAKHLRRVIRQMLVEVSHEWVPANRKNMLLDKPGMEDSGKENQEEHLKSMGMMEETNGED